MRRSITVFFCLCLTAALLTSCGADSIREYEPDDPGDTAEATAVPEATAAPDATAAPEPTATPKPGLGYAAYDPDEVVLTYDGKEVTWREYYYWLNYFAGYVKYMAAMGMPYSGWDGQDFDTELDNASMVRSSASEQLFVYRAVETLAERENVSLDEQDEQTLSDAYDQAADNYGDGDGETTDDELTAYADYLDGQFMTRDLLDYLSGVSLLSDKLSEKLYGADGADVSDADALAFAEEEGLMRCKHILLMTVDPATGEALSDEEKAEKKAQADELYDQLAAVQDDPEALEALFDELMQAHSEDTGLAANPDGYTFGAGVMVPVFEDTTADLEEYGLSAPVESDYGYHIILRLPVDPDGTYTSGGGSTASLRTAAASDQFYALLDQVTADAEVVWQGDFETVDIAAIFGE